MNDPNRNDKEHDQRVKSQQQSPASADRASSREERSASARNVEEQQPVMRSVAISPQTRTLHFEPALRRAAPSEISHLQPLRGVAAGPQFLDKAELKQQDRPRLSRKSKSLDSLVKVWSVDHASLTGRPDNFPLLRTSRVVHNHAANAISGRISNCLQSRSIRSKFSKGGEGNAAKCRNTDFCKFTISLYAAEDGGVLVEVHRLCGDCISFMKDCRAILNAAEGKTEPHPHDAKPLYLRLPVSEMKFLKMATLPPVSREEEVDCVNLTTNLLSSCRSDANMLGMESLVVQTDPLKSLKSTAVMASRMILCPNDPQNSSFNAHNYVMSLLIYGEEDSPSTILEGSPLASIEDHAAKLRNLAASALSNALALLASEGLLSAAVAPHREWYSNVLVPGLLRNLSSAARHPHDACHASRCLSALAECSPELARAMKEGGGEEAVESAEEVGAREFAMLARDAGNYRNILSCCV